MTKRIRRPRDRHVNAEAIAKIFFAMKEMTGKRFSGGKIGGGVDDGPPANAPPPPLHIARDAFEGIRIGAFDVLVNRGFAADESELWIVIHEIQNGSAGDEPFIKPFAPIPKPDRIEVGIGDEMECKFGHLFSNLLHI